MSLVGVYERDFPVLTISIEKDPGVLSYEKRIACGCGKQLVYGRGTEKQSTWEGERVVITSVARYHCDNCGLTAFLPEVAREIQKEIIQARKRLSASV